VAFQFSRYRCIWAAAVSVDTTKGARGIFSIPFEGEEHHVDARNWVSDNVSFGDSELEIMVAKEAMNGGTRASWFQS
jgi:hypothetical protein